MMTMITAEAEIARILLYSRVHTLACHTELRSGLHHNVVCRLVPEYSNAEHGKMMAVVGRVGMALHGPGAYVDAL